MLTSADLTEIKKVNKNLVLLYSETDLEYKVAQNTLDLITHYENLLKYKQIRELEDL